jgi:methoxymalonate biosynthesis protein
MRKDPEGDRLVILGAGVMGTGIATMVLGHGVPVCLVDIDDAILARARVAIERQLRHGQLLGAFPAGRTAGVLMTATSLTAATQAVAVIEAVTEDAAAKAKVLAAVSALVPVGTPVISNTSSIPIEELARTVERPADFIGVHFMNPAYLVTMTEVIPGPQTYGGTVAAVSALLKELGRGVVVVHDAPGFVTSRLLHPMINEAARIVGTGTATVEAVDRLMEGCLGHPVGPLRTADMIGLDNLADALRVLAERTGNEHYLPCGLLRAKVAAGDFGRKTGRGFYEYGDALP